MSDLGLKVKRVKPGAARRTAADLGVDVDVDAVLEHAGLPVGYPFIASNDGFMPTELNRWLRWLPGDGVYSSDTIAKYATEVLVWGRWLEARGRSLWEAETNDLRQYKAWRLQRVSPSAVNRGLAAISHLYTWAEEVGRMAVNPVPYSLKERNGKQTMANDLTITGEGPAHLKYAALDDIAFWCDHGLGYQQDRLPRNGSRNLAYTSALLSSGLRRTEMGSQLRVEVAAVEDGGLVRSWLGRGIAKWSSARWFFLADTASQRVRLYVGGPRTASVDRSLDAGRYDTDEWIKVNETRGTGRDLKLKYRGASTLVYAASIETAERQRLLLVDRRGKPVEPMALWLGENGMPFNPNSWNGVFHLANQKVAALRGDEEIWITPHVLRHTFATNLLGLLVGQLLHTNPDDLHDPDTIVLRRHLYDPLRELMRLMGHRQLETTYRYLHTLADNQTAVRGAVTQFGAQLPPLDAVREAAIDAEDFDGTRETP